MKTKHYIGILLTTALIAVALILLIVEVAEMINRLPEEENCEERFEYTEPFIEIFKDERGYITLRSYSNFLKSNLNQWMQEMMEQFYQDTCASYLWLTPNQATFHRQTDTIVIYPYSKSGGISHIEVAFHNDTTMLIIIDGDTVRFSTTDNYEDIALPHFIPQDGGSGINFGQYLK